MNATRKRRKVPIISTSGGFAGEFTIQEQKAGEIKWHRDEQGPVMCDIDSFKKAVGRADYEHPVARNKVVSSVGGDS